MQNHTHVQTRGDAGAAVKGEAAPGTGARALSVCKVRTRRQGMPDMQERQLPACRAHLDDDWYAVVVDGLG